MILSTLDTNYLKKQQNIYLLVTFICLFFGMIYEMFSHQIYSLYMIYAFLIPFLFGYVPTYYLCKKKKSINRIIVNFYNASIGNFTLYSIFRGILEIYGTTNQLLNVYLYVGLLFIILSMCIAFIDCINLLKSIK